MSQQKNEEFEIDEEVLETDLADLKEILSANQNLVVSIKKDVERNKKIREVLKRKYPFGNLENPKLNKFNFWINTPKSIIDQNTAKGKFLIILSRVRLPDGGRLYTAPYGIRTK